MYREEIDIIIGLPWFKSLCTFILNMEKKFVTFPYKEKMITLQDTKSELVTLEDFNNISKVILQENKKVMQGTSKEFHEFITEKNEEISCFKGHNKKLLVQIKKAKVTKKYGKKLEQEKEDLKKELKKNLTEKKEENSRLKNLNQEILEQIKKLKEEKLENPDIKDINKSRREKINKKRQRQMSKYKRWKLQILLTNKKSSINKATSAHEENHVSKSKEENATSMIKGNHLMRTPYQHSNHKSIYINQLEYQYYPRREPYKHPISQKIEVGWENSFAIRRFCSTLRHSYHLVSSTMTTPKTVDERTLQVKEKFIKPFINML
jgi:hypothetical protein